MLQPTPDLDALPSDIAMQQHPFYAAAVRALGGQAQSYPCTDKQGCAFHVQVIQRTMGPMKLAWVPRGPAWPKNFSALQKQDVLDQLAHCLPRGTMRLITADSVYDASVLRDMRFREVAAGQQFARLDLCAPQATRLALQHGKWRNRLRHAEASNIRTHTRAFDPDRDQMLLRLEATQRRKLGYRTLPADFTRVWASANQDAAQVFAAEDPTGLIAFFVVLVHAPSATYHIGWTSDRGRLKSCHNLLLWQASNWLSERGIQTFDLGLIDAKTSPGLARFKLGTGAVSHATAPTMIALPRLRLPKFRSRAA